MQQRLVSITALKLPELQKNKITRPIQFGILIVLLLSCSESVPTVPPTVLRDNNNTSMRLLKTSRLVDVFLKFCIYIMLVGGGTWAVS